MINKRKQNKKHYNCCFLIFFYSLKTETFLKKENEKMDFYVMRTL